MPRLKTETRGENLATQFSWATDRLVVTCLSPIKPVNGLLIVRCMLCVRHETISHEGGAS